MGQKRYRLMKYQLTVELCILKVTVMAQFSIKSIIFGQNYTNIVISWDSGH